MGNLVDLYIEVDIGAIFFKYKISNGFIKPIFTHDQLQVLCNEIGRYGSFSNRTISETSAVIDGFNITKTLKMPL